MLLCRLRYAAAALTVTMAALLRPNWVGVAVGLAAVSVALSGYVQVALRRMHTLAQLRQLGNRVFAMDVTLAGTTYAVFLGDANAIPAAFLPLLVFELAARYRRRGEVIGLAVFVSALCLRIAYQEWLIPDGALRTPLLLVWVTLGVLLLALSRELSARDQLRLAVLEERERIAKSFRTVIGEVLSRSGVPEHAASAADVLEAVRRICDERSNEYTSLAVNIADMLVPAAREFGLTRREREVVGLLAMGYSYERIAKALFVSGSTVRNHVHHVRGKLGLSSRDEVVAFARRQGITPSPASLADTVRGGPPAGDTLG